MSARSQVASFLCVLCCACAGAVPDPARMAEDLPPFREVSAARRAELDAEVEQARAALVAGDPDSARAVVQRVLEYDPRHPRARAILGQCHLIAATASAPPQLEEFRLAEGELRRATALAPSDPLVARFHAGFLIADGHLSAAAERVAQALAFLPHDPDLLELGGRINFDLGNERAAVPLLTQRLELVPGDAESTWRLAWCQARLCAAADDAAERSVRANAAAAAFQRYVQLVPGDVEGLLGEAWTRMQALPREAHPGDLEPILALYDSAARLRPESAAARFGRALALQRAGRLPEMRDALRETLSLDPHHAGAVLELAADAATDGRAEEARTWYRRALELDLDPRERRRVSTWLEGAADGKDQQSSGRR